MKLDIRIALCFPNDPTLPTYNTESDMSTLSQYPVIYCPGN